MTWNRWCIKWITSALLLGTWHLVNPWLLQTTTKTRSFRNTSHSVPPPLNLVPLPSGPNLATISPAGFEKAIHPMECPVHFQWDVTQQWTTMAYTKFPLSSVLGIISFRSKMYSVIYFDHTAIQGCKVTMRHVQATRKFRWTSHWYVTLFYTASININLHYISEIAKPQKTYNIHLAHDTLSYTVCKWRLSRTYDAIGVNESTTKSCTKQTLETYRRYILGAWRLARRKIKNKGVRKQQCPNNLTSTSALGCTFLHQSPQSQPGNLMNFQKFWRQQNLEAL